MDIGCRNAASDEGVGISSGYIFLPTGQTTIADVSNQATASNSVDVGFIYLNVYRAIDLEFDVEIYIDGVRYI